MRRLTALAALAALAGAPPLASAQRRPTLVAGFPAGDAVPRALVEALSIELGRAAEVDGAAVLAQSSRADLLAITGCPAPRPDCLAGAMAAVEVDRILVAEIDGDDDGATVRLLRVEADGTSEAREVSLDGDAPPAMARAFRPHAEAFARGLPAPLPEIEPPDPPPGGSSGAPRDGFSFGAVAPWTWVMTAGGAATVGVGVGFLVFAANQQRQVDEAATETVIDLERLALLESDGKRNTRIGNLALLTGAVVAAVGVVLIVRQGRRDDRTVRLAPAAIGDGAGLSLSIGDIR